MEVGIGLPNAVTGTTGEQLVEFAREGEKQGFSSLGTIDRLVYDNYDPFVALGAAAAVTERIRLLTSVLIVPYRLNAALTAKQAASVHALSGGRLVVGAAIGAREDDYEASGITTEGRGARFDKMLEEMKRVWEGEERGHAGAIGPLSHGAPHLIVGGQVEAAFKRVARFAEGWIMGGGPPDQFAGMAADVKKAWSDAGREGGPRLMSLAYFSLGPEAEENAKKGVGSYYEWLGEIGDQIVASVATDPETVRQYASAFEQAGCDELVFFPASGDPEQASRLAEALGR
jgi:alkanesulfonate monooxygenase SsuD/methylene tetrahydromethanopterin reductase-like flavin-dependent oxidoreductase (luciferase family)